jgi:hypothetical protein
MEVLLTPSCPGQTHNAAPAEYLGQAALVYAPGFQNSPAPGWLPQCQLIRKDDSILAGFSRAALETHNAALAEYIGRAALG